MHAVCLFPAKQFPLQSLCYHVSVAAYYIYGTLQAHRIFIAFVSVINGSFFIGNIRWKEAGPQQMTAQTYIGFIFCAAHSGTFI